MNREMMMARAVLDPMVVTRVSAETKEILQSIATANHRTVSDHMRLLIEREIARAAQAGEVSVKKAMRRVDAKKRAAV
jgi:predicted transcriptional regulator